jgi:carbon-monoxide dehydrogenase small subunit
MVGDGYRRLKMLERSIVLTVNGIRYEANAEPRRLLSDFLREELELKGAKLSCDIGICGACTVLMDGKAMRACLMLAVQANGREFFTVEGLANGPNLHPLQEAFWECHALQCGFCTPGMLMSAHQLLATNIDPSDAEIREAISGNLCRCTGYIHIVDAIRLAARRRREGNSSHSTT